MWGNQLSDNYNTTTKIVNERKKTKFVKRSEQRDYLNRIEMKKNEPMNMFIENKGCQSVFFCKRTNKIEVIIQNLLHRKQTNLGPLRRLYHFMIGLFRS